MAALLSRRLFSLLSLPCKYSPSFLEHWLNAPLISSNVLQLRSSGSKISRWSPQAVPSLQAIRLFTTKRNDVPEPEDFQIVCRSAFFGCVNQKMPEDVLEEYFTAYGEVDDLYLIRNFRGRSRGLGVVVFRDAKTVDTVLDGTHKIDESVFKVQRLRKYRVLKVEGLPDNYSEDEIRELFSQFGEVAEVEIHKEHDTVGKNGYCLVSYSKQTEAIEVMRNADNLGCKVFNVSITLLSSMKDFNKLPSKRVVVYNLPYTTTVDELYQHFKYPCPTLREIHLRLDSEKKVCLAFLQFDDPKETDKIIRAGTMQFGGKEISFKKIDDSQPFNSTDCALFVENIPNELSRDRIYHHFKEFGRMSKVTVKENKGFGFVRYYLSPDALVASRDREHVINNHTILVRRLTLKVPKKVI